MKGNLIVISGPSGVGKDSICNYLVENYNNYYLNISMTTREKRDGEKDGINYYYVSKDVFEEKIKEDNFIEYALVYDNYYGTPKDKVYEYLDKGIDVLLVLDIQGALSIKEKYKDAIFIFLLPPDMKTLLSRVKERGGATKEKIIERFKEDYKLINEYSKYNYVVVNDNLSSASEKVNSIVVASKCSVERFDEFNLDNPEEIIHDIFMD